MLSTVFILCSLIAVVTSVGVPNGFLLDVDVDCGNGTGYAAITVLADLPVRIEVECDGSDVDTAITGSQVRKDIDVSYAALPDKCSFKTPALNSGMHFVTLHLYYGRDLQNVQNTKESYTVTCLNTGSITEETDKNKHKLGFGFEGIVKRINATINGTIVFDLVDVRDNELKDQILPLRKKVQLKAVYEGGAAGIMVSDCLAVGLNSSSTYPVVAAGCGDGAVFSINEGFDIKGKVIRSPYFPFFSLPRSTGLYFVCNFTECLANCDGDSCLAARGKRSIDSANNSAKNDYHHMTIPEQPEPIWVMVSSVPYMAMESTNSFPVQRSHNELPSGHHSDSTEEVLNSYTYITIIISIFGSLTLIVSVVTFYFYCKQNSLKRNMYPEYVKA